MRCAGYSAFLEFGEKGNERTGLHVDIRIVRPVNIDEFEDVFGNILVIKLSFSGLSKEVQEELLKMDLDENLLDIEYQFSPSMAITSGVTMGMKKTEVKKTYMINIFTGYETIEGSKREKTDTVIIEEKTYKKVMKTLKMLDAKETFETLKNIIEKLIPIKWEKYWEKAKCTKKAKKKLTIRIDPEIIEQLKIISAKTGKTVSQLIEETAKQIIKEYLKNTL